MNRQDIRRAVGRALVLALCVAALTAIVAVLDGDFDDTDGRIIAMSLGFGMYSALGASGAGLRQPGRAGRLSRVARPGSAA